jgi:hypothetical protein
MILYFLSLRNMPTTKLNTGSTSGVKTTADIMKQNPVATHTPNADIQHPITPVAVV